MNLILTPHAFSHPAVAFTEAADTDLRDVLRAEGITLVETFAEDFDLGDVPPLLNFDWRNRDLDENNNVADFMQYVATSLQQCGVVIGRSGFQVLDMHTQNLRFNISAPRKRFRGGIDGYIVPYKVARFAAENDLRAGIEFKVPDAELTGDNLGGHMAQAGIQFIAACTTSRHPPALLLTNGIKAVFFRLRGSQLEYCMYENMATAIARMAGFLTTECIASITFSEDDVALMVGADTASAVKRLRADLGISTSPLLEQLQSVLPFVEPGERLSTAGELIAAWYSSRPMSTAAEMMYM
jgi:hypothetical protein